MRKRIDRRIGSFLLAMALAVTAGRIPAKAAVDNGWETVDGGSYWYENGVKQGTEGRGKEIYDPASDAWYWLDSVGGGRRAVSKDVYQESPAGNWADRADGIGKWVRYNEQGQMIKGWDINENGTYYFDPVYGTMAKGYAVIDGELHYFHKITGVEAPCGWDGINGWVVVENIDGNSYWYENGVRQGYDPDNSAYRGKEIYDPESDAWYWLDNVDQGKKAVGKDVYQESAAGDWAELPDGTGKWVRYDAQGHMMKGWNTNENGVYYFDPVYGTMAKGIVNIDGKEYEFDKITGVLLGEPDRGDTGEWTYTEAVAEELLNSTDYRVEAKAGTGGELVLPQSGVTSSLKEGDILVLPQTPEWQDGLILKVGRAQVQNGEVRVTGEVPNDPLEVYQSVSIRGTAGADVGNISPEDGVGFRIVENGTETVDLYSNQTAIKRENVTLMDRAMEFKVAELSTTVSMRIPEITYDLEYDKEGVKVLNITLPNEIVILTEASKEFSGEKKLGRIPFRLPAGFSVEVELALVCSVEGNASIELRLDNIVGACYENGNLKPIVQCSPSETITLSADAAAGAKLEAGIYFAKGISQAWDEFNDWWKGEDGGEADIKPMYNVGAGLGAKFEAELKQHLEAGLTCVDVGAYLYLDMYAGEGSFIGDTFHLKKTWSIYDRENSPLRKSVHLEKRDQESLKSVEKCTFEAPVSLADCTVLLSPASFVYDGTEKKPAVTVKSGSTVIAASEYTVSYSNHVNAGTATAEITAKSGSTKVTGSRTMTFTIKESAGDTGDTGGTGGSGDSGETGEPIEKTSLSDCRIRLSQKIYLYDGTEKKPGVTVKSGDAVISADEYTVDYFDNVKIGTAGITISAKDESSKLSGKISLTFAIEGEPMYRGRSGGIEWWISQEENLTVIGKCGSDGLLPCLWEDIYTGFKSAYIDVEGVKDLSQCLSYCFGLESVDLSQLDTSQVWNMAGMFSDCYRLESVDLSGFDTSNVTTMFGMFNGSNSLKSLDLSNFNTSNVTDMSCMFACCYALSDIDVSSFDTSKVTDMRWMFSNCQGMKSLDLSSFDTGNADVWGMFMYSSVREIKVGPGWTKEKADTGAGFPGDFVYE